ncbi:hypothetical protein J2W21_000222 [Sinomonas atrocyanea]|nr:hypothetical protein [Sinomonas atrocyanea]
MAVEWLDEANAELRPGLAAVKTADSPARSE